MSDRKRVLITGAASGIGAASAKYLGLAGWEVVGLDRKIPADAEFEFHQIDLADEKSIDSAVDALDGGYDALCNVAGLPPTAGALPTMKVNFFGLRQFTEAVAPKLSRGGAIVNVASLAGAGWPQSVERAKRIITSGSLSTAEAILAQEAVDDENCYFVSKECLILWTLQSWNRWRDLGVRMNAVSPGPVLTPIYQDFQATLGERAARDKERSERPATPEEIAPAIAFLCSRESSWIRATNIAIDDGLLAAALQEQYGF